MAGIEVRPPMGRRPVRRATLSGSRLTSRTAGEAYAAPRGPGRAPPPDVRGGEEVFEPDAVAEQLVVIPTAFEVDRASRIQRTTASERSGSKLAKTTRGNPHDGSGSRVL